MKIAIIGGAGFIGVNLYFFLKKKKYDLKVIDNLTIKTNHKFIHKKDFIKCDIRNYNKLRNKIKNFDIVVNLAGQTGVIESNRKPNYCIEQNIIGFSNILNIVAQSKKKMTVINASTAGALYGDTKKICSENDEKKPLSYYGLTKFFNEQLSELFFKLYNVKIINLRFANVYGEYSLHKKSLIHT